MAAASAFVSLLAIWLLVPPVRPIHAQEEPEPPPPPEAPAPEASEAPAPPEAPEATATPPRLSYLHGDVSFWRPGAEDWAAARVNTPLAGGDSLYVPQGGNVEVQAGPRAFVRAGGETDLGFDAVEPDFLQLKVTSGHAAIDLRNLERGHTVEVDTPHLAATIDQPGYYRVDVDQEATTFVSRRGGSASVVPAGGEALDLGANDEVIVKGADNPEVERYTAPNPDPWDRWNYTRTDHLTNPKSPRYVPQDVSTATGAGVTSPSTVRCGSRPRCPPRGRPTAPAGGSGIRSTAGPGSTTCRGAGRRITTVAGSPSAVCGDGRPARSSLRPCTRPRSSPSSVGVGSRCRSVSGRPWSVGCRSAGASRAFRGGDRARSSASRGGAGGVARTSSTTWSSSARPSSMPTR